ncbi:MAG TPA: hypothetical protein VMZ31_14070 [Phycisphaerae bacterium]|nr:hypothetical protein [Phycisphaerae bacterium]
MSTVPPNIVGPILQTVVQQQQAAQTDDAEKARGTEKSERMAQRSDRAEHTVADTDSDSAVDPEAGQGGGQGRAFSEPPEEQAPESQAPPDAVTHDENGQPHIDVQA